MMIERFSVKHYDKDVCIIDHLIGKIIVRISLCDVEESKELAEELFFTINNFFVLKESLHKKTKESVFDNVTEEYNVIDWKTLLDLLADLSLEYDLKARRVEDEIGKAYYNGFTHIVDKIMDAITDKKGYNWLRNRADDLNKEREEIENE